MLATVITRSRCVLHGHGREECKCKVSDWFYDRAVRVEVELTAEYAADLGTLNLLLTKLDIDLRFDVEPSVTGL